MSDKQPLKLDSLLELQFVSDPALSGDATKAAAVVTCIEDGNPPAYRSAIHLFDLVEGTTRPFTQGMSKDTHPRFSPDGSRLAFLSDRDDKKPQLYLLDLSGGEARRLSELSAGVLEFAWHPDGERIALISRGEAEADRKGLGRDVGRTYYKQDGVGFRPETSAQVWTLELATGKLEQVTSLATNVSQLAFAPDGSLIFTAARTPEDEGYYYRNVWRLELSTGSLMALIDQPDPLIASSPSVSPDGQHLAYLAPSLPERISSPTGLWLVPMSGGTPTLLTGELDCLPLVGGDSRYGHLLNTPSWLDESRVLVNGNQRGSSFVVQVDMGSRTWNALQASGRAVTSFAQARGAVLFTAETPTRPGELFLRDAAGNETRLSSVNDTFVQRYALQAPGDETLVPTDDGETEIAFWTLHPAHPREDDALVLQVHGGPRTNYGYGFSFEFQLLAAHGYTVVYGNPRGGSSYGYTFSDSISGRLGTLDADDVMTVARYARANHTDRNAPIHLTGGSYGGFMTNWLVTQTDFFTSAVTQRSITNWLSFFGTSDIGFSWIHVEVGGNPWEQTERLWNQSPMKYVHNVHTPLLILHAEEDYRCPIEQAEQFFTALRVLGREVAFTRFPEEDHELSRSGRPDRRLQRLEHIVNWFESHPKRDDARA